MAGPVHYEIYTRKSLQDSWALLQATENRKQAVETAEDTIADKRAVAVRVTKETLDPETMEFQSITILSLGAPEVKQRRIVRQDEQTSSCLTPQDLYAPHAREVIGRVLEDWLARHQATPFELLHRPDLAEVLEASGVELLHAVQKVSVPESQATGLSVHDLIRHYQKLAQAATERVIDAGRKGRFADLGPDGAGVCALAETLQGDPDRGFLMGGAVCGALKGARGGRARLDRMMDLLDAAPAEGPPRAMVLVAVEQILCELFAATARRAEILGPSLDLGGNLAAIVRMVAPNEMEALIRIEPRLAADVPPVDGPARRLAERLAAGEFRLLAAAMAREVIRELKGSRRLRPGDAAGEIDILRTLAMALTATTGRLLSLEEVQDAFVQRSRTLVTADFVGAYTAGAPSPLDEAAALVRLCENVTGAANKRAAARWLSACVGALRFETELSGGPASQAASRLAALAALHKEVCAAALGEPDEREISQRIGLTADRVERDARLIAQLVRSPASPVRKLSVLLRLASGDTAPPGPVAERARAEAIRLFKAPDVRAALSAEPGALAPLHPLMKAAGLAA
ncbi:MAG: hypothetical protein ACK4FB_00280 [Brevundimonas sp.]|uniref:hypothetical protein n=1 Tax=Brevundimonas sp. TaxID=1871086 RepID=UPI003919689F